MNEMEMPKRTLRYELYKIAIRFLILLGATVLISVIYKGLIEAGAFGLIRKAFPRRLVFCAFEFLLLAIYWHFLFVFSTICRHNSRSLKVYYIRTLAVFTAFNAVYWLSYLLLSREVNMWIFRATFNLICFRFVTTAPENLIPYMIAYLAITFLIMMLEPVTAIMRFNAWRREMEWSDVTINL